MSVSKRDIYYLRLSKEDGDSEQGAIEESCSITSQRECIRRYLQEHGFGDEDFEEIVDDGYSGTSMNRPGMKRLLRLVEEGGVRTIIVRDLSRFARNYLEAGHYIEFVFPVYDVRFISIQDQFDSVRMGENTGGLELAVKNLLNQMYSKDLSQKIKSSVDLKKMNGEYVYGTAPYGYKKGAKKNTIVVDEEAAVIVRAIFAWAAEGKTITQIARKLNEQKVMTPSVYLAAVRGNYKTRAVWTFESVRNILANRIYTGDTVPFKSHVIRVGSDRVKQIPEELWQVIPDTHEALITREMFYKAKLVVRAKKKSRSCAPPNPFTSFLVCGCCGNRLTKGKPQNKNWMCVMHRYHPGAECAKVRFREDLLTEIVLREINMRCKLLDAKMKKIKRESHLAKTKEQILRTQCQPLRRQMEKIQASQMQYYESYVSGQLTKDAFLVKKQEAAAQEETLGEELLQAEREQKELALVTKSNTAQADAGCKVMEYREIAELTPGLMRELVKKIIIYPGGSLRIEWNFCDEIDGTIPFDSSIKGKEK